MAHPVVAPSAVTSREREVWALVAAHLTNKEIAQRLCLSVRTVESHVSALIQKLHVADRRALARHEALIEPAPAPGNRWPAPISTFVGRAAECAALRAVIDVHRMVTLTGPGGVGKTRLALRVVGPFAATRREGGFCVDLVHVSEPSGVTAAIAAACGVAAPLGESVEHALVSAFAGRDAVILLDNCEHVLPAVRECVARLLAACPSLAIVATSRIALRAPFEWVFPVPGLSLNDGGDAAALFVERALAAGAAPSLDPARVQELCSALDGMALAIELAAARCPALGLDGLVASLDSALQLLSAEGDDDRHRSLRATIAWSVRLLADADRALLADVSVFAGGFDVDAALAVTPPGAKRIDIADALARLADHNLLRVETGTPTRYRALEAIRQFGAEQLGSYGRAEAVHARHRHWCRNQLADLALPQARDETWLVGLDRLADEARAALAHAVLHARGPDAAELAEHLAHQLLLRGRPQESQRGYEQAAALSDGAGERARLLRLAAGAAASRLVGNDTLCLLQAAADEALASGDRCAAAIDLAWKVIFARWAPGIIAVHPSASDVDQWLAQSAALADGAPAAQATIAVAKAVGSGDSDAAAYAHAARAVGLAREAALPIAETTALDNLCTLQVASQALTQAIDTIQRRTTVMNRLTLDASTAYHFNDYLLMAAEVHLAAGQLRQAAAYADRLAGLACYRDYPHPALARRITVDALAGDFEAATERGARFLVSWERAGRPVSFTLNVSAYAMAMVHGMQGDDAGRTAWTDVTLALTFDRTRLMTTCDSGWAPTFDALLALDREQHAVAFERLAADIDDRSVWNRTASSWRPWYAALWAECAVLAGFADAGMRVQRAAVAAHENPVAATIVERAGGLLRGRRDAVLRHAATFARLGCAYQARRTEVLARRLA